MSDTPQPNPSEAAWAALDAAGVDTVLSDLDALASTGSWPNGRPGWAEGVIAAFGLPNPVPAGFVETFALRWAAFRRTQEATAAETAAKSAQEKITEIESALAAAESEVEQAKAEALPGSGLAAELAGLARRVAEMEAAGGAGDSGDGEAMFANLALREALMDQKHRWSQRPAAPEEFDRMAAEAIHAIDEALSA